MPEKVLYILAYAGLSVYVYVVARLIGRKSKRLEDEDRAPKLQTVLFWLSVVLMVIAFPASVVLFPLELSEKMRGMK